MPMTIWQEWALLEDQNGFLGFSLWRAASDILLWNAADPVDRDRLFSTGIDPDAEALTFAAQDAPAVADAVQNLWTVYQPAETVDAKSISNACYQSNCAMGRGTEPLRHRSAFRGDRGTAPTRECPTRLYCGAAEPPKCPDAQGGDLVQQVKEIGSA